MENTTQPISAEDYPGVEWAYPIAVQSYEVGAKRLEIMDGRLQTIMAFVATVSAVIPSIGASRSLSFNSWWFLAGAFLFATTFIVGSIARLYGRLKVLSPNDLYEGWLWKSEWTFKTNFIAFAGSAFSENLRLADKKWRLTVLITGLFFAEVVCLVFWVVSAPS